MQTNQIKECLHIAVTSLGAHQADDDWFFNFENQMYKCSTEAMVVYGMCARPYEDPENTIKKFIQKRIFEKYGN